MGKGGYLVLVLLLIFAGYGFLNGKSIGQVAFLGFLSRQEEKKESVVEGSDLIAGVESSFVQTSEKNIVKSISEKLKLLEWIAANIDEMILSSGSSRVIEEVCFRKDLNIEVEFLEDKNKKKWLLRIHNTSRGFFPEFKSFFIFQDDGLWKLESGLVLTESKKVDCYVYDTGNEAWSKF